MNLSPDYIAYETIGIIYVAFMIIMGIKTAIRYSELKDKIFLYAGWSFIGLGLPWVGEAINFAGALLFGQVLSIEMWLVFTLVNIPVSHIIFIVFVMRLLDLNPKTKKVITSIYIIFWVSIEILFLIVIFTNPALLASYVNEYQLAWTPLGGLILVTSTILVVIFYSLIGVHYWKSEDKKLHTQGKLIVISALIFTFSASLEVVFTPITIFIIISRVLGIIFATLFYAGFIMPKWAERIFLNK
ncbi:MAG: hypothetical protein ACFFDK_06065 [Promethearchaeota archaeon]